MEFCEPAEVVAVTRVTPSMIRVRLRALGEWTWYADGRGDERVDIAFPWPGETRADVTYFNREHAGEALNKPAPPWRHYTMRAIHDRGREFDVEFVVHGDGIASTWAERAEPGHVLGIFLGSTVSHAYHSPPDDAQWQLLVADATGLPGLARIVEELPEGVPVQAIVEVPTAADRRLIETRGDVHWTWLIGPGGRESALPTAVEGIALPETPGYAWVACESSAARSIRTHLRRRHSQPRDRHRAIGFWTAGKIGHDGRGTD